LLQTADVFNTCREQRDSASCVITNDAVATGIRTALQHEEAGSQPRRQDARARVCRSVLNTLEKRPQAVVCGPVDALQAQIDAVSPKEGRRAVMHICVGVIGLVIMVVVAIFAIA
jgi:hypothetical protein